MPPYEAAPLPGPDLNPPYKPSGSATSTQGCRPAHPLPRPADQAPVNSGPACAPGQPAPADAIYMAPLT